MHLLQQVDSYKYSHWRQNPPGCVRKWSYIEPRGGDFANIVFFGLQMWLKKLRPIYTYDVLETKELVDKHMGLGIFNADDWKYIADHKAGALPVRIEALPEGTVHSPGVPQVQVSNTDPRFPWLPAFIETSLLRGIWYPSTVATISRMAKEIISATVDITSDNPDQLPFKLHDFGARGVSSGESAGIGGVSHLVNFQGTDTIEALAYAEKYYGCDMAGFSIPAAEHSTITSWGREREKEFVAHMVESFAKPGKLVAVVGDSYSIYNFTQNILGDEFKAQIARTGGTLVERPDSGDPVQVPIDVIKLLMKSHGYRTNSKGYAVLPDYIRVIQGDGMCIETISMICSKLREEKIAIDNIAFGMGGALLQKLDRDTLKYAMKTCAMEMDDGRIVDVFKKPVTDVSKSSKAGIQAVVDGRAVRLDQLNGRENQMRVVFEDGHIKADDTLDEIRSRASVRKIQREAA